MTNTSSAPTRRLELLPPPHLPQVMGDRTLRLSAMEDPALQAYFAERPNFQVAVAQMAQASSFPCIKLHPKTERTLDVLWERIFIGQEDVQKVADEVAAEAEVLMQEMNQ